MAKEKKRGFFSWLGFGQKEQTPEKETEVQNEQPVVEEIVQEQEPVKASEQAVEEQPQAHTEAEAETFAADVVEVTEQVAESEKAQPEAVQPLPHGKYRLPPASPIYPAAQTDAPAYQSSWFYPHR